MKRTGTALVCLAAIAMVVWLRPFWRKQPPLEVIYEGIRPVAYGKNTNHLAFFRLRNPGTVTVYYQGTPYPVYILEQKNSADWVPDGALPDPEVLCPIFPGKSFQFSIPCPDTTNQWRMAISMLLPSRAPVLLRRYFKPRQLVCRSATLITVPPAGAGSTDSSIELGSASTVR